MAAERTTVAVPLRVQVGLAEGRLRWHAITLALILVAAFTVASGWAGLLRHEILGRATYLAGASPSFCC